MRTNNKKRLYPIMYLGLSFISMGGIVPAPSKFVIPLIVFTEGQGGPQTGGFSNTFTYQSKDG